MDRFIVKQQAPCSIHQKDLKSNMDRFIVYKKHFNFLCHIYLKSNMDRFIGLPFIIYNTPFLI